MSGESRHEEIVAAVEEAVGRLDARERADKEHDKKIADTKERLSNRVSIAAIALTMLMSFLGFARGERDDAQKAARSSANQSRRDVEANWALYQTKVAERSGYLMAEDALTREVAQLTDGDPRIRIAEMNHIEYGERITALDNQNRQVFFVIQQLRKQAISSIREAEHIDQKISEYDMGTRVLTLALVILSVTLLASQEKLFWIAVATAYAGAGIAIAGYFT